MCKFSRTRREDDGNRAPMIHKPEPAEEAERKTAVQWKMIFSETLAHSHTQTAEFSSRQFRVTSEIDVESVDDCRPSWKHFQTETPAKFRLFSLHVLLQAFGIVLSVDFGVVRASIRKRRH